MDKWNKWIDIWWYRHLFAKPERGIRWGTAIICRFKNHPCGPIYYNANGLEPDNRCRNCWDEL